MQREYVKWWSPSLGRDMEMLVFGFGGTPILVFPSSMGRFFEWEDFRMIEALSHQINQGYNQVFCVDSVDKESFYNDAVSPYVRIVRHRQYDSYINEEVIPFIHTRNENHFVVSTGASFGAYHALNVAFKYPGRFAKVIAMSGKYDIRGFLDGFYDNNVYFNNPVDYVPNLNNHEHLESIRRMDIRLVSGDWDMCMDAAIDMGNKLNAKSIPHVLDVWGNQTKHDWPWWRDMIRKHIV
jgi:esterase/lipase superfamily enzyme